MPPASSHRGRVFVRWCVLALGCVLVATAATASVNLRDDPKGFSGIPWGSSLAQRPDMALSESSGAVKGYERKDGPLMIGDADVESMRFLAINDRFARVIMRYRGKTNHDRILPYLESQYGAIERLPGQMMRGLNQQYNWRGTDTEINLTYQSQGERGFVSFDSRELAPRFMDQYPDNAY